MTNRDSTPFSPDEALFAVTNPVVALRILRQARSLIEHGWCQDNAATTRSGVGVHYNDATATHFCAYGAVLRTAPHPHVVTQAARLLGHALGGHGGSVIDRVQTWNDAPERTRGEVLAVFDQAIAVAEIGQKAAAHDE